MCIFLKREYNCYSFVNFNFVIMIKMIFSNKFTILLILNFSFAGNAVAETSKKTSSDDYLSLTLQELLNTKVVTSTKTEQTTSQAPAIISVITAKEIKQMGANTLAEVLAIVPGFTPLSQIKSDRLMLVRGLSLKDGVLVLIDGVTVNDAFEGDFDFYQNSVENIARVEIIRGPGSALYGGYAVSAVIQIFTKQAYQNEHKYSIELGVGSFAEKHVYTSVNQDLSSLINNLKVAANFYYSDNNGDKLLIKQDSIFTLDLGQYLPPLSNPSLTPTIRQESVEKFNGNLNINFQNINVDFNHQQLISKPLLSSLGIVTEVDKTIKESTLDRFSVKYDTSIFEDITLRAKTYWVTNEKKFFGQSQPPLIFGDQDQDGLNESFLSGIIENFQHRTQSIGAELEFSHNVNTKHELLAGIAYEKTKLLDVLKVSNVTLLGKGAAVIFPAQNITNEFMPLGIKRSMTALYFQDLYHYDEHNDLTAGIQYNNYSDFGTTINPRVALVHRFSSDLYTKILYGKAFKPPSFAQSFDSTPTQSQFRKRGNSNLKPTEISSSEIQLGYHFSEELISSVNLFQNKIKNEIFFDTTPGIEQWRNIGERTFQGAEFEFKGAWLGLDFAFINYSFQQSTDNKENFGANIHPQNRINTGGSYQLFDKVVANFTLSYFSSPQRANNDDRVRMASKTLVRVAIHAQDFLLTGINGEIIVSNVFNMNGRDETEDSLGILDDIPLEGRNIRFSLTCDF